ncbi:hypothetical protein BDN70DRAFT_929339 [Pholiota conissans]|uniref:Heterokaryon incompatibility domain-containing protein n=1 Tax=Pholiota conissans TaxID=109636 RepID=A0A9P5Z819_9AGAR|nr:hypothetical protein BDN70DRAFT_929339 [Pholiota conissans]
MATTDLNPGRRSSDVGVEGQASPPSEVQIELLKVLYKVIAPLVQAELPSSKGLSSSILPSISNNQYPDIGLDNVPMGREAEDPLAALQKYISTLIRDGTKTRVVNLGEMPEMENESKTEGVDGQLDLSTTPPETSKNSLERLSDTTGTVVLRNVLSHVYSYLEGKFLGELGTSREEAPSSDIFSLDSSFDSINKYAILSHTWLQSAPEITYDDWRDGNFDLRHEGYRKLVNFCRVAHDDYGLNLGWMDTVCIDKTSSSELDESIRSMYKWYEKAEICIIHLADTSSISNMTNDRWFSRGWTLQELLAPRSSKFCGGDWKRLIGSGYSSDKNDADTQEMIYQATGIMPSENCVY